MVQNVDGSWVATNAPVSAASFTSDLNAINANFQSLDQRLTAVEGAGSPPGTVVALAGPVVPSGWLACDGRAVSRTTYATLFAAIGTVSGSGDGATTFNLPDYRGMFLRGLDTTAGAVNDPDVASRVAQQTGGNANASVGTYEADAYRSHDHALGPSGNGVLTTYSSIVVGTGFVSGGNQFNYTPNTQFAGGSETRPKNVAVTYIIKS
jgi:microcystin-dependent protein